MMQYLNKYTSKRGFSLVELSVVLTIIGITLAGAIDLATRKTESDRITETNARMDAIEQALQVFLTNNMRLPCPADNSLALSNGSSGVAGVASQAGNAGLCSVSNNTTGNIYSGGVPTKTLGIADKFMSDDWDRRFTYVVDARFANNLTTNSICDGTAASGHTICFKQTASGGLTINDSTATARSTEGIYVLISHGKNGSGAYKYTGSATRLTASTNTDEQDNAGNDKSSTFDAVFVQADTTTTFDDIARYKTKALIIDGAKGITDSTTCTAASDAVNNKYDPFVTPATATSTDPCSNGTTTTANNPASPAATANCYTIATLVNTLCLQP